VHTASFSLAVPRFSAQKFGHHFFYIHPLANTLPVTAMGLGDHIFFFQGGADSDSDGFFTNTEVSGSMYLSFSEEPGGSFFKSTGLYHF
jgi:hypothetical protein